MLRDNRNKSFLGYYMMSGTFIVVKPSVYIVWSMNMLHLWWFVSAVTVANAASIQSEDMSYDTIVVGLGASGTMAATTLAKSGRKVLGLEAQDRIGGRVHTVQFGDGVVELGAEWIHGTVNSSTYSIAMQHTIDVRSQDISFEVYRSDGSTYNKTIVNELLNIVIEVIDEPPEVPEPVGEFVTKKLLDYINCTYPDLLQDQDFITELLAFCDLVIDNYEASNSWNDVSTDSKYEELAGDQHMSWHRLGYKTLFELMMNTYNNGPGIPTLTTKLNTEVTKIDWPQDPAKKVVVTCKDGSVYTADNVIVTVSIGVLKAKYTSLFSPPLPELKTDSIKKLQMGLLGKVILEFPQEWWDYNGFGLIWKGADKAKIEDCWITKIAEASTPMGANRVLTLWMSGDTGRLVETLPEDVVKTKSMELLRMFMGANITIPEPIQMIRSTWHTNPYTRGSYTYDSIKAGENPKARVDLSLPLTDGSGKPRVLFAGEATNPTHFSTVHGAVDSGHREAMRLLPSSKL